MFCEFNSSTVHATKNTNALTQNSLSSHFLYVIAQRCCNLVPFDFLGLVGCATKLKPEGEQQTARVCPRCHNGKIFISVPCFHITNKISQRRSYMQRAPPGLSSSGFPLCHFPRSTYGYAPSANTRPPLMLGKLFYFILSDNHV